MKKYLFPKKGIIILLVKLNTSIHDPNNFHHFLLLEICHCVILMLWPSHENQFWCIYMYLIIVNYLLLISMFCVVEMNLIKSKINLLNQKLLPLFFTNQCLGVKRHANWLISIWWFFFACYITRTVINVKKFLLKDKKKTWQLDWLIKSLTCT